VPARDGRDLDAVRELIREYANRLGTDLVPGLEAELAGLPGAYAPPTGELLVAWSDAGKVVGCVGVRPLTLSGVCEMKRLYVRKAARGTGAGRALAAAAVRSAAALGYRQIMLDTLPAMASAIALYRALGFEPTAAYGNNPVPGFIYFAKNLDASDGVEDARGA